MMKILLLLYLGTVHLFYFSICILGHLNCHLPSGFYQALPILFVLGCSIGANILQTKLHSFPVVFLIAEPLSKLFWIICLCIFQSTFVGLLVIYFDPASSFFQHTSHPMHVCLLIPYEINKFFIVPKCVNVYVFDFQMQQMKTYLSVLCLFLSIAIQGYTNIFHLTIITFYVNVSRMFA